VTAAQSGALLFDHRVTQCGRAADERQQHGCPPDVQVGVVFPGVTDAAVYLHVLQRRPLIRR